jgi:23S rRNA (cytosine1962-C5)-methyltransferase
VVLLVTLTLPPCLIFEDDDLLVVHKPPGMNTHAPAPYHNEGLYEWLRHREPRWADLGLIHRLDKETSGLLLFTKSSRASRSLASQFAERSVAKRYLFLTDRPVPEAPQHLRSVLVRAGHRSVSRPPYPGGEIAETHFQLLSSQPGQSLVEARPITGRPHQVRVHAAELGFPVLGDSEYGGSPASRLCLHAEQLCILHPVSQQPVVFQVNADFSADPRLTLRLALVHSEETTACRILHGAADGHPGWYVDRLGDQLLSQSALPLTPGQEQLLQAWMSSLHCSGASHKVLHRQPPPPGAPAAHPIPTHGLAPPRRFTIRENQRLFHLDFEEGYSVGLFLDQRDNRRRLLTGHVAAGFPLLLHHRAAATVLNTFAYTCAFSVCAASVGAHTTSIDLSRKYLDWGQDNFRLNHVDPTPHVFLHGDVFSWLRRLARRSQLYDLVLLDPPTFSRSKESGTFRAETDYPRLVAAALPLLKSGGVLFASSNTAQLEPDRFLDSITDTIRASGRAIQQQHYAPQPPDFPITRSEPAHLKSVWLRIQ